MFRMMERVINISCVKEHEEMIKSVTSDASKMFT